MLNNCPRWQCILSWGLVYTLSNGVQPAWAIHLYCLTIVIHTCQTHYHNFSVCDGERLYYQGAIPTPKPYV
ncbi:hypothetical protein BYT27DRAFT_7085710 [Phlegmacium glaucopus]|nr:hypothetical protein BYT27DRAFT_7085710 [Phlegmacium glaucopus]